MTATLRVDEGGIARLTLAAPDTGNAIGPEMGAALRTHAETLAGRDDVRAVVFAAEGKAFCVGGDIRYFASAEDPEEAIHALAGDFHVAITALGEIDAPVIARVQGVAAGGGLSLVLAADLAVAAKSARFSCAYTRIGLSPDGGQSWLLPRIVGYRRAAELLLSNRVLDADEADRLGIVSEVVDDERLDARVDALAATIADGPLKAHGVVKRLLRRSATATLEEQLMRERESIAALAGTPAGREGVAAFVEKRRPEFRGA